MVRGRRRKQKVSGWLGTRWPKDRATSTGKWGGNKDNDWLK